MRPVSGTMPLRYQRPEIPMQRGFRESSEGRCYRQSANLPVPVPGERECGVKQPSATPLAPGARFAITESPGRKFARPVLIVQNNLSRYPLAHFGVVARWRWVGRQEPRICESALQALSH